MKTQTVRFPGTDGELAGRLDRPDGPAGAWALVAHCFTCGKDLKALGRLSRALVDRGFGVLRFDFAGIGESEGDFAATNFASNLDDLRAAAEWLEKEHGPPSLLVGHSLGGAAVLVVAGAMDCVRGVVTVGAPSDTAHLRRTLLDAAPELEDETEEAEIDLAGRTLTVRRQLLEDLAEDRVLERTATLGRPLLVLHSPVDEVVGIDHARKIYEAARHPKSFVSLDDADHLLLEDPSDARYVGEVISAWAGRYVQQSATVEELAASSSTLEKGQVRVEGGESGYRVRIEAGRHRWIADEPTSLGGSDEGPTPYDHLLAALGSCTVMTLRMYADRKEIPLRSVRVDLTHSRIHAKDCESCATKEGKVDRIDRVIRLDGELDEPIRTRLLEIADRCPVHRTLSSEIEIRSREE